MTGYFSEERVPDHGEYVTPYLQCIRHHNATPLTYTGTNTWIVRHPSSLKCIMVDPGPHDEECFQRNATFVDNQDLDVVALVLTHHHLDHAGGAKLMARHTGAQILQAEFDTLRPGKLEIDGVRLNLFALSLPGHSHDSMGLYVEEARAILTGDVIFQQSPTMVAWPDGNLQSYLASLDTLERFVRERQVELLVTAHGPVIRHPIQRIREIRAHRLSRLEQVVQAVRGGVPPVADAIVDAVYNDVPAKMRPGSLRSVNAQLEYCFDMGLLVRPL